MNKKLLLSIICLILTGLHANATAAPSTQQVQISGLNPITFSNLQPFGTTSIQEQVFCVYSSSGNYNVTVTTSSSGGALMFPSNTGANNRPFQVFWNNQANGNGSQELFTNQTKRFTGASTEIGCNNTNNTYLRVVVPNSSLHGIRAGKYQTSLIINVSWAN